MQDRSNVTLSVIPQLGRERQGGHSATLSHWQHRLRWSTGVTWLHLQTRNKYLAIIYFNSLLSCSDGMDS